MYKRGKILSLWDLKHRRNTYGRGIIIGKILSLWDLKLFMSAPRGPRPRSKILSLWDLKQIKPNQWNTSILKTRFEKEVALLNLKEFCEARGFVLRKGKQFYFACKQLNFNF